MDVGGFERALSVVADNAGMVDANGDFPDASLIALREAGVLGLLLPREVGGGGGGIEEACAVVRQLARRCGSTAMVVVMHFAGSAVVLAHGPPDLQRAIGGGDGLLTLAFSERRTGSRFWAPVSTARETGSMVELDGQKSFVTSASQATHFVWSSRPVGGDGLSSLWLVPAGAPGMGVGPRFDGIGLRGNDSRTMDAVGLAVEGTASLGGDGQGFAVMMSTVLPVFQLLSASCSIGLAAGALDAAIRHAAARSFQDDGAQLRDLPTVRAYLARSQIALDMATALTAEACAAVVAGRPDAMLRVLSSKAAAAEMALEVTATCMRVCGGAAFRKELAVDRAFRDAQAASVMGPTTDVLLDFVGKAITGLPLFA